MKVTDVQFLLEGVYRRQTQPFEHSLGLVDGDESFVGLVPDGPTEKRRHSLPVVVNTDVTRCDAEEDVRPRLIDCVAKRVAVESLSNVSNGALVRRRRVVEDAISVPEQQAARRLHLKS
ncbi:hypothetical protein D320_05316 [Haloferax sp. BAB-2207]|nr:hypothetical protein D320_05316 [Haloferax sp. BAB-2207]